MIFGPFLSLGAQIRDWIEPLEDSICSFVSVGDIFRYETIPFYASCKSFWGHVSGISSGYSLFWHPQSDTEMYPLDEWMNERTNGRRTLQRIAQIFAQVLSAPNTVSICAGRLEKQNSAWTYVMDEKEFLFDTWKCFKHAVSQPLDSSGK